MVWKTDGLGRWGALSEHLSCVVVLVIRKELRVFLKRALDIFVSFIALLVLSPLLLTIATLVGIRLGAPVFFRQVRPGLHGRPFELLKFRTMTNVSDADGDALPDAKRLTTFGCSLRASSLDELPELWNVLKGDMSLVGPRPLLMEYLTLYSAEQARRHELRPGLTGWAQVNGRNEVGWEDRFKLDVWYVDNWTLWLDLRILLLTTRRVVARDGITARGEKTMPKFTGNH